MDIKPINTLTRNERRALAESAADNGEQLHDACPYPVGTLEQIEFQDDFVRRRHTLLSPA